MGEKFLRNIARSYVQKGEEEIFSTTFVFPNRRSSLFFKKYLSEEFKKPLFSPRILTISELFNSLYDVQIADRLTLLSILYQEWIKCTSKPDQKEQESLDDFFYWGDLLLSDFSDVDFYMVDARQLFINTAEYKDLTTDFSWMDERQLEAARRIVDIKEFWGQTLFSQSGQYKKKFINYWNVLWDVYSSFRNTLKERGLCYTAMQYRTVAEAVVKARKLQETTLLEQDILSKLDDIPQIAFIGFSAPTNCEKELMRYFQRGGKDSKGKFYWDYFSDFIKSKENKSSLLIDKCVEAFKNDYVPQTPELEEINAPKEINAYPVIGLVQQALAAGKLLEEIHKEDPQGINTAVVVSDENLLLPLLGSIPECYKNSDGSVNVNITMGYPLSATPVFSLLRSLMKMTGSVSLRNNKKEKEACFETNALIKLLSSNYLEKDPNVASALEKLKASKNYYTYFSDPCIASLSQLFPPSQLLTYLETKEARAELIPSILDYYSAFLSFAESKVNSFEKECFYLLEDAIFSLKSLDLKITRLRTLNSLLTSAAKGITINFKGEPLKGLQIMGPLETRLLDFDNVVFLSFNEGTFPTSGEQRSAIPYSLRAYFGLPTYEFKDSVSAYNFYRLSQRAKRLYCIFDTEKSETGLKEESRFLKQLKYGFSQQVNYHFPDFNYMGRFLEKGEEFPKNEDLKNTVYSASLLNSYFDCPLKFYLNGIKELDEDEELEEGLDSRKFGTLFHAVMEKLYAPYYNKVITKEVLESFDPSDKLIEEVFRDKLSVTEIDRENIIIKSLIKKYVKNTLKRDLQRVTEEGAFTYLRSEKNVEVSLFGYKFKGYIDRIDQTNGKILISDYKTGLYKIDTLTSEKFKEKDFEIVLDEIFNYTGNRKPFYENLFQLLLYALLLREENKIDISKGLQVALYQVQKILTNGYNAYDISNAMLESFKIRLKDLMDKINSPEPGYWERNIDTDSCSFCPFNNYCIRK